jgi:tRNA/tmRNA/rRNA uracil-C5-methylase (TrmA/RlmC/RlmD family)
VTAEPIAAFMAYYAGKIPNAIVVDGCCGVGGNIIQFGNLKNVDKAIGVELSSTRASFAEYNAKKYKDAKNNAKTFFINKSFMEANLEDYYKPE